VTRVDIGRGLIDVHVVEVSNDVSGTAPPLVFLHEGLGSIELWRSFPDDVRAACGGPTMVVYSRHGYGRSAVVGEPRAITYMHDEALVVLPSLLAELGIERPVLVGHSDGASIALIHAGAGHRVAGLVLLAPHVFVEDVSVAGIEAARDAYRSSELRARLARYHDDVDAMFWGWNDVWLSPAFRRWNIESYVTDIDAPVLLVQGSDDAYGTLAQLDAIERAMPRRGGPAERLVIPGAGHTLHVGAPAGDIVAAMARFYGALGHSTPP